MADRPDYQGNIDTSAVAAAVWAAAARTLTASPLTAADYNATRDAVWAAAARTLTVTDWAKAQGVAARAIVTTTASTTLQTIYSTTGRGTLRALRVRGSVDPMVNSGTWTQVTIDGTLVLRGGLGGKGLNWMAPGFSGSETWDSMLGTNPPSLIYFGQIASAEPEVLLNLPFKSSLLIESCGDGTNTVSVFYHVDKE